MARPSGIAAKPIVSFVNDQGQAQDAETPCPFSDKEKALLFLAPKITDVMILGGYTLALERGWLDQNKYLKLGATILATGALIDYGKDIFAKHPDRDIPRFYNAIGAESELERFPFRLFHAASTAAFAVEVGRGYYSLFKNDNSISSRAPARKTKPRPKPKSDTHLVVQPSFVGVGGTF